MNTLQDRVALATGSSRGIGAAIATLFASEGARVVVHGRDTDAVETVRSQIEATGAPVMSVIADLTRYDEIEGMRDRIEQVHGPVEILVANAGGSPSRPGPIEEISEEAWRASVDANLTATFLTIKCFLTGMKERGRGNVITMSSAGCAPPKPRVPDRLRRRQGRHRTPHQGRRRASWAPRRSGQLHRAGNDHDRNQPEADPRAVQETLRGTNPIRRLGTPEDVAQTALFLASDNSAWISGIVVDVAGGSVLL
jgi:3-oxoacyl-[acyl-carrier protein] reductase